MSIKNHFSSRKVRGSHLQYCSFAGYFSAAHADEIPTPDYCRLEIHFQPSTLRYRDESGELCPTTVPEHPGPADRLKTGDRMTLVGSEDHLHRLLEDMKKISAGG